MSIRSMDLNKDVFIFVVMNNRREKYIEKTNSQIEDVKVAQEKLQNVLSEIHGQ